VTKRTGKQVQDSKVRLRELSARLEAVREEERTRVAQEIHDELGQALTALSMDLSWVLKRTPPNNVEVRERIGTMVMMSRDLIKQVRRIASDLRPSVLDDLGLVPAIEWQLSEFRKRTGIQTRFRSSCNTDFIDGQHSTALFRVVQEALTNVIRHAKASRVEIILKVKADTLIMSIVDNGRGISQKEIVRPLSLGLAGMTERINRLGGEFRIGSRTSRQGRGTQLDVFLPNAAGNHHD
jgi:signal transduction histidine kinase